MAFGISFVDIELLIRLSQNQTAESEPVLFSPDAEMPPVAEILILPETLSSSDSFSTKNSATNIVAAVTENIPHVFLNADSSAEKSAKSPAEENNKVAGIVFNSASQINSTGIKQSPPVSLPASNNQSRMDAEIIFRSLLEKFRASVVYDYEVSDAVQLVEDAERKYKPFENSSRFADSSENRQQTSRKKAIQDKENFKQEAFRNETKSDDDKKRELLKRIREANKFL
jgi:hypothetical protein